MAEEKSIHFGFCVPSLNYLRGSSISPGNLLDYNQALEIMKVLKREGNGELKIYTLDGVQKLLSNIHLRIKETKSYFEYYSRQKIDEVCRFSRYRDDFLLFVCDPGISWYSGYTYGTHMWHRRGEAVIYDFGRFVEIGRQLYGDKFFEKKEELEMAMENQPLNLHDFQWVGYKYDNSDL